MACWNMRQGDGWLYPTAVLCVYGFLSMMRPAEPFLVPFLTGPQKNFTVQQISRDIYPIWAYSSLFLLIPMFLLTDMLRYKPIVVLQALAYLVCWLLFSFGHGLWSIQLALFAYSLAMACDLGYFCYIYSMVGQEHYQRVTSYARAAVLLGYAMASLISQLLVSIWRVSLFCLNVITITCLCGALLTSLFLPMPQRGVLLTEFHDETESKTDLPTQTAWRKRFQRTWRGLRHMLVDCKEHYSSVAFLFFCIWFAMGKCGYYQISEYVQILWNLKKPENFTVYNGGVDAVATLSGAAASVAVGHTTLNWSLWGELALGVFSTLSAGSVYLMDLTSNIWICYACYIIFKSIYMQLITICVFQIAKTLSKEHYALVLGINNFAAMALQALLTAVVLNTKSLQLTVATQFLIYATYFGVISLIFLIRGVYSVYASKQSLLESDSQEEQIIEGQTGLPEATEV
ncbi:thiamine transporter 2-like [Alosa pseudoharengus]|uniref:thiamine transporter 2-like n=1 Tax=Alosa pseudoharengus TaxID=34774 RepID=UPI003F8BC9C0